MMRAAEHTHRRAPFIFGTKFAGFAGFAGFVCLAGLFLPAALAHGERRLPSSAGELTLSFAGTVQKTAPSVVTVYARRVVKNRPGIFANPFFERFFGGRSPFSFGVPREKIERALGSGVILDASGLVVTNHHVVKDAEALTVSLSDRREFDARLVLADEATDLAVLQIESDEDLSLPSIEISDSDEVRVGDIVLALGNPFGVGQTVTNGIISAPARARSGISDLGFFLQTDAAINVGNSGGALVSLDGKLVGINTAIYASGGGSVGVGFAIPSNMVRFVLTGAREGGVLKRPWTGARFQSLTTEMARTLGLPRASGALVRVLHPKGPAKRARVETGDVIIRFNGYEIEDHHALRYRIALSDRKSLVRVVIWRDGKKKTLRLRLEVPPEIPPRNETRLGGNQPFAGALVANISPALAEELNLGLLANGVVILSTAANAPAGRLGLRRADIIRTINTRRISDVDDVKRAVAGKKRRWRIAIERDGKMIRFTLNS